MIQCRFDIKLINFKVSPKTTSKPPKTSKANLVRLHDIAMPLKWTKIRRTFHTSQYATSKIIKAFIIPSGAVNVTIEELNPSQNKLGNLAFL